MQINDFNLLTLFVHHLNLSSNHKYNTAGLDVNYCFEEKQNILYIHFEGSSSVTDWLRNFLFAKEPYRDMTFSFKVHRGFLSAWNEVKDIIYDIDNSMSESFHGLLKDKNNEKYIEIKANYSYLKIEDDKIEILNAVNNNYTQMKKEYIESTGLDESYIYSVNCKV